MRPSPMELVERLKFDLSVAPGICCICKKKPVGPMLELGLKHEGMDHDVTVCRHCLAEYAPTTLAAIEEEVRCQDARA